MSGIAQEKKNIQINIFLISLQKHILWVLIRSTSEREVLLMSTHNICFHGEIRKLPILIWLKKSVLSEAVHYDSRSHKETREFR